MQIESFKIEGFRSFKSIEWKPGPLNVLIGPNGSGKSNLLRSLQLLASAASGGLSQSILSKGGMGSVVWDGAAREIVFVLDVRVSSAPEEFLAYGLHLARVANTFETPSEMLVKSISRTTGSEEVLHRSGNRVVVYNSDMQKQVESTDQVPSTDPALAHVSALWGDSVIVEFQRYLKGWAIYHDLRVDEGAEIRRSAVTRAERRVSPDGQNLIPVLHTLYTGNRDFEMEINKAMRSAFPDDFAELRFPPAEDNRVQMRLRRKRGNREDTAAELSDGTIRFLLLLTILATPDPPPLIAIDEPEVGLHPSMLPIIAEFAVEASRRTQVILSTHAPQMLDAFGETLPATTVFSWAGDHTELKTISGGELKKWVEDYSPGRFFYSGEAEAVL